MLRHVLLMGFLALTPDIAIAWVYCRLSDREVGSFWAALGVLWAVQAMFAIKSTLGTWIAYRLYGKQLAVDETVASFVKGRFPRPEPAEEAHAYLLRLSGPEQRDVEVRLAASVEYARWGQAETHGLFAGLRMASVYEAAVSQYRATP